MQPDPPTWNTRPAATSAPSQARIEFESALGNFGKIVQAGLAELGC